MKIIDKYGPRAIKNVFLYILSVFLLSSQASFAQPPCKDPSLNISTGAWENRNPNNSIAAHRQDITSQGINDKHWVISNITKDLDNIYNINVFNYPAKIVPPCNSWALNNRTTSPATSCPTLITGLPNLNWPESHWISALDATVPAFSWPVVNGTGDYAITFKREFTICDESDFAFNIVIASDNYCNQLRVDGRPIALTLPYVGSATNATANYTQFNLINNPLWFVVHLTPGTHNIEVDVNNFSQSGPNPIGLNLSGTIWDITNNPSIVNDLDNCSNPCATSPLCPETCYWTLHGNSPQNINDNIFGTRSNQDIRLVSNFNACGQVARGIITGGSLQTGGYLGWNTSNPTARLHVNCINGNPDNTQNPTASDIRFENLEKHATGSILSIDASGYVFNTNIDISTIGTPSTAWNLSGNNTGSNDWLGTINNNPLKIYTNKNISSQVRMTIYGSPSNAWEEGFVGINTATPTARLHVDCNSGNENNGLSDIRFQGLEVNNNELKVLGIDANGYVYNTNKTLSTTVSTPNSWDLGGNTLTMNKDFGTISAHDVNIITSGNPRGVFDKNGYFGWHLSSPPSTNMDVDATNPNAPSGIRFENLPPSNGEVIVVDPQGYLFNSGLKSDDIQALLGDGGLGMIKQNIDDLKKQLEEEKLKNDRLQSELNTINAKLSQLTTNSDKISPENRNELYQNTPNPFGTETSIGFNIVKMQQTAFIAIYDLNGRELYRYNVSNKGKGSVSVSGEKLIPGQYLYSLIVDGQEVDTKKMVVTK